MLDSQTSASVGQALSQSSKSETDGPRRRRRTGARSIPPLETGDRLDLREFLRRYEAMPNVNKAELIEGVVFMSSPVRVEHSTPHNDFNGVLFVYKAATPGVAADDNATTKLDPDNGPQPDCHLRILAERGGQTRVEDGLIIGAPEFIAEISASTVSYDLHDKFTAYQRSGVREYVVWRVWDEELDWFVLRHGKFERVEPDEDGILKSTVFPGLWLHVPSLLDGDLPRLLEVLQQGIATPEHAAFVELLAARRQQSPAAPQ